MNSLIIGIAGGSGSGKTTLALRLKARFGEEEVRLIPHDSYYKRHDELPYEKRCLLNYDHPDAFDNDLLVHHLKELKAGRAIDCPVYDYSIHNRSDEVRHIEPAPVLIVEGILPFTEPALLELFDYKIFVDTDADERILRRILRDVKERGRSLDSVITQYLTTVKPMHEAFVEPSKAVPHPLTYFSGRKVGKGNGGDRVQWMKQGAAVGATLQFSQEHSYPQRKLAKRKRVHLVPMTAVVLTRPCRRRGFSRFGRFPGCAPASPTFCQALQMKPPQKDQIKTQIPVPVHRRSGDLIFYEALLRFRKPGFEAVCIVPCRRHKRRERAGAERPRGSAGDPETVWYPMKLFARLFHEKAGKPICQ